MRNSSLYLTAGLLAAMTLVGCNSAETKVSEFAQQPDKKAPVAQAQPGEARRITIKELQDLLKNGQAFVVDVRNQASYDQGHIPGAKLIPAAEILNHLDELPRDKTIVTYCS